MLPDNFAAFILTHGRATNQKTLRSLKRHGYTGKVYLVVDNEDAQLADYQRLYGDMVQVFDKADIAARYDEADNFNDRRAIFYARNACFEIAANLGIEYFIQLDDDYQSFEYKITPGYQFLSRVTKRLDAIWGLMLDYFIATPRLTSIAMAQGGDFIGGRESSRFKEWRPSRKAMNSFICATSRPFRFVGRINEDVNTYTLEGSRGALFLTVPAVSLVQGITQANAGGMTDLYKASGTFVKSFYSVMMMPSAVKVGVIRGERNIRLHHQIDWASTVPMILREAHRKAGA